ncbi:MAG: hypothetical protein HYY31_06150 [Chloroflexi bacterium]|nr:hypothetical protein [Chloroflexota bacterium]
MTVVSEGSVLSPVPTGEQGQGLTEMQSLTTLAGKNIGFLSTWWPNYKPLVEELEKLLGNQREVRATPRLDYWRRPRLSEVWKEGKDWLHQVNAAVVGLGA